MAEDRADVWRVGNDSPAWYKPRRLVYFLWRTVDGKREDYTDKAGRLRTWREREPAQAKAYALNLELVTVEAAERVRPYLERFHHIGAYR